MPDAMICKEVERLVVFYACDELDAGERAAVEAHTQQCPACATLLARELRLLQAIAAVEQPAETVDPAGALLAQCRSELEEAIDEAEQRRARPRWLRVFGLGGWLAQSLAGHPAWSAALLILIGVAVGAPLLRMAAQWRAAQSAPLPAQHAVTVSAAPRLSDHDLQTLGISGINWVPNAATGSPSVELHLTAEKPLVVQGSPDDTDVKRVLTYVVQNGQWFDPGVRLDSLDVLRMRSSDREVRQALCAAVRRDRNPAVRLKALEALRGFEQEDTVRQALLDALLNDSNPGVRVEAINSLQGALQTLAKGGAAPDDQRIVSVLRDRMQRDPNNYIRMQSAAAIRQLGPRQVY